MNVLFLYTELADYTMACLRALKNSEMDTQIMVIHYPVNPEAPFQLDYNGVGDFYSIVNFRKYADLKSQVQAYNPTVIICSGWGNKMYLRLCREFYFTVPTVLTMDNHWSGTFKQKLLKFGASLTLLRIFRYCWVPGDPQVNYAKKLGFASDQIFTGFYCCDLERFNRLYYENAELKQASFPHRIICVARYIPSKNYNVLWNAFIKWRSLATEDWELWCAGTGSDYPSRIEHPAIKHLGFVLPDDWSSVVRQTGVFILPSLFEPWGVVVQEFAASGFPLILSEKVGSASQFLNVANGFQFDPESEDELIACFERIGAMSDGELLTMGQHSHDIANQLSLGSWVSRIHEIAQQGIRDK